MNIYPFTVAAQEHHSYAQSPTLAISIWQRDKRFPKVPWYALDLIVQGPTEVTIRVRDIADTCLGGIGEVVLDYAPALEVSDLEELAKLIKQVQLTYAERELQRREEHKRKLQLEFIRHELFDQGET